MYNRRTLKPIDPTFAVNGYVSIMRGFCHSDNVCSISVYSDIYQKYSSCCQQYVNEDMPGGTAVKDGLYKMKRVLSASNNKFYYVPVDDFKHFDFCIAETKQPLFKVCFIPYTRIEWSYHDKCYLFKHKLMDLFLMSVKEVITVRIGSF